MFGGNKLKLCIFLLQELNSSETLQFRRGNGFKVFYLHYPGMKGDIHVVSIDSVRVQWRVLSQSMSIYNSCPKT